MSIPPVLQPDLTAYAQAYRSAFVAWVEACLERAGADRATVEIKLNPLTPSHAKAVCGSPPRVIGTFAPRYVRDAVQFEAWVDLGEPVPFDSKLCAVCQQVPHAVGSARCGNAACQPKPAPDPLDVLEREELAMIRANNAAAKKAEDDASCG